jgi:hypothetical protein
MIDFQKRVKDLLAKPCWRVRWDNQLNLDLSFGEPKLHIREPYHRTTRAPRVRALAARRVATIRAEYWLWIYVAQWKIKVADGRSVTQSSSSHLKNVACATLEGEKVNKVEIDPLTGRTRFTFDLGSTLEVRRINAEEDAEMWTLYKPHGLTLSVRGDGRYKAGRATAKNGTWRPLPQARAT